MGYGVPVGESYEGHLQQISAFPATDKPEALGLHPNMDWHFAGAQAEKLFHFAGQLLRSDHALPSRLRAGLGGAAHVLSVARRLLRDLPRGWSGLQLQTAARTKGEGPRVAFFVREAELYTAHVTEVKAEVQAMQQQLQYGAEALQPRAQALYAALLQEELPRPWGALCFPCRRLWDWLRAMRGRYTQLQQWYRQPLPLDQVWATPPLNMLHGGAAQSSLCK